MVTNKQKIPFIRNAKRKETDRQTDSLLSHMPSRYKYAYMVSISELLEIEFGMHRNIK
jgi:hypothetical protein